MTYTFNISGLEHHIQASSYRKALGAIPFISERSIISISETNSKGTRDGRSYRDFLVDTKLKSTPEKAIYLSGEFTSEIIRVYGSYSGRSLSL